MATEAMHDTGQIERLITEVLEVIPSYTPTRGTFNSVPELGYEARNPEEWQREFQAVMDESLLGVFGPDIADIITLVELLNYWTVDQGLKEMYTRPDGTPVLLPVSTLSTIVGYALLEMIVRRLEPGVHRYNIKEMFVQLGGLWPNDPLVKDLKCLNSRLSLYDRLKTGRDLLMHGSVLRLAEPEANLLVLLVDLIVLHTMRRALEAGPAGQASR